MRRKRVYLGDSGQKGNHRRPDASPASNQVAVLQGILDQFLRTHVNHIIVVIQNGIQFRFDTLGHKRRRSLSVNPVHFF